MHVCMGVYYLVASDTNKSNHIRSYAKCMDNTSAINHFFNTSPEPNHRNNWGHLNKTLPSTSKDIPKLKLKIQNPG